MAIHSTAVISGGAVIDDSAQIGPYAVIGPSVKIGARTKIGPHVVIDGITTIGSDCNIFAGAAIGLEPQDLHYHGEPTSVIVGDRCTLREYVTIHRATGEGATIVGDDCFLMNYVHIAHNCKVGKGVIFANSTVVAGHGEIGDYAVISGMCVFHQFVRVGRMVMVSGLSGTRKDLPPFSMCDGRPSIWRGINRVGLKRNGVGPDVRTAIKESYRILYRSGVNISQALALIEEQIEPYPEIREIIQFIRSSKRGLVPGTAGVERESMDEVPADVL